MILCDNKKIVECLKKIPSISEGVKLVNYKHFHVYSGNNDVEIVVGSRSLIHSCQVTYLPGLRFVQVTSSGIDGIYPKLFASRNVAFANAKDVYSIGIAEFVVYAILMQVKRYSTKPGSLIPRLRRDYNLMTELEGKTVGIMGVGSIGKEIAKRLAGFGVKIIGFARKTKTADYFEQIYHKEDLHLFCEQCDYLVSTLPDTPETIRFVNKEFLRNLKPTICFVNVGRKVTINDSDFISFLKENKKATAILDMFEMFPLPWSNKYKWLSNVKVLPGITAISKEIDEKLIRLVVENIRRSRSGEYIINLVK